MERKNEIVSFLSNLTIQEKKQGYSQILDLFLNSLRLGYFKENESSLFAHVLHNLPNFLGEDLMNFNDERFWDEVLNNTPNDVDMIFKWFMVGVEKGKYRDEIIKEMKDHREIEKAE